MAKVQELKTEKDWFDLVWWGKKNFEIRFNDRDYQSGDILVLREWDKENQEFGERSIVSTVTEVWVDFPGLQDGYVVLSLSRLKLQIVQAECWVEDSDSE